MASDTLDDVDSPNATASHLPYSLVLELTVQDTDAIAALTCYREGEEREQFALQALRIGVLALRQARGTIDGDAVRREGERLLEGLQGKLGEYSNLLQERLNKELASYFDPQSGKLHERLERLLKSDGELEATLRRQVGSQDSELCKTLVRHVGQDSPLLKALSPDQSQGLFAALRGTLEEQLQKQREQVLNQFSLDNKEGALSRFIGELTQRQGSLSEKLHDKINEVVKEFSLDEENSALTRLVRNVEGAQKTITAEFSLDGETSALSRLKRMLEDTNKSIDGHLSMDDDQSALSRLRRELLKLMGEQGEANQKFQEEVKGALQALAARRAESERSTRHGIEFEAAVVREIQKESHRMGDLAEATGATTGLIKNCKVGDGVVELGPESAAPGARLVIEAKEKAGYSLANAREEIELARKNRDAQVGLFVFSKRTAPDGLEPLARFGQDVFVVWDIDDLGSDLFLRTGLTLARALAVRAHTHSQAKAADFEAMDAAILDIEKRANSFDEIEKWAQTIQNNGEKILEKVRILRDALVKQVGLLREKTDDLKHVLGSGSNEVV
jgi:hypothetical protein